MSTIDDLIKVLDESDLYFSYQTHRATRIDPPEYLPSCRECGKLELEHIPSCIVYKLYEHITELEDELNAIENRQPNSYT